MSTTTTTRRTATPLVTRMANELVGHLDLVTATGAGGRVTAGDVRRAAAYYAEQRTTPANEQPDVLDQLYGPRAEPVLAGESQEIYDAVYGSAAESTLSAESQQVYTSLWPDQAS